MSSSDGSVLVVDDDQVLAELLAIMLRRNGYEVTVAVDGVAAQQAIEQHPEIELVVCDLELGRDSGVEVMRKLREIHPGLAGILVSGHQESAIREALANEPMAFLQKPFEPSALIEAIVDAQRQQEGDVS